MTNEAPLPAERKNDTRGNTALPMERRRAA